LVCLIAAIVPLVLTPLETAAQSTAAPRHAGKLERITVHGPSLIGNLSGDSPDRRVSIYLPASYATASARRYPVLYLLHGFTDSDERWFGLAGQHFVNVPTATDRAVAAGSRELIIVMPNAFTRFEGSMYSSSVATGDWETFVARDLVSFKAIAIDAGDRDLPIASTVERLSEILTSYGIAHDAEIYDGDHVNRIEARPTSHVLPFFARHLAFE
jgi:enterochelin esterase-like enzyme